MQSFRIKIWFSDCLYSLLLFVFLFLFSPGIGSLLSVLPHLIVGEYNPTVSAASNLSSQPLDVCVPTNSTAGGGASCILQYDSQWFYLLVFIASQILIGVGSTALFSLGPAYLDENLHPKSVPVYIGFWYSTTWLGPGLGFILGGVISTIYVDITLVRLTAPSVHKGVVVYLL